MCVRVDVKWEGEEESRGYGQDRKGGGCELKGYSCISSNERKIHTLQQSGSKHSHTRGRFWTVKAPSLSLSLSLFRAFSTPPPHPPPPTSPPPLQHPPHPTPPPRTPFPFLPAPPMHTTSQPVASVRTSIASRRG